MFGLIVHEPGVFEVDEVLQLVDAVGSQSEASEGHCATPPEEGDSDPCPARVSSVRVSSHMAHRAPPEWLPILLLSSLLHSAASATLQNFRDLHHIPLKQTHTRIKPNTIFRAASPANVSLDQVQHLNLNTVLDLRAQKEALKDQGPRILAKKTKYVNLLDKKFILNLLFKRAKSPKMLLQLASLYTIKKITPPGSTVRESASRRLDAAALPLIDGLDLVDVYLHVFTRRKQEIRRAMLTCVENPEDTRLPLLVHCTHGKDRTGLIVALLLHVCGASIESISADYAATAEWCATDEGRAAMLRSVPAGLLRCSGAKYERFCDAQAETIVQLFDLVGQRWGSVDAYLDGIGIDEGVRAEIRHALTEPVSPSAMIGAPS